MNWLEELEEWIVKEIEHDTLFMFEEDVLIIKQKRSIEKIACAIYLIMEESIGNEWDLRFLDLFHKLDRSICRSKTWENLENFLFLRQLPEYRVQIARKKAVANLLIKSEEYKSYFFDSDSSNVENFKMLLLSDSNLALSMLGITEDQLITKYLK